MTTEIDSCSSYSISRRRHSEAPHFHQWDDASRANIRKVSCCRKILKWNRPGLIVVLFLLCSCLCLGAPLQDFDIVITHGHIIDGTGSPWYSGDVGIRDGKIAAIGNLNAASRKQTIDAGGRVVAPGFIDMLGQSELTILVDPRLPSKIFQGITTEVTGEGSSVAPVNDAILQADHAVFEHYRITPD